MPYACLQVGTFQQPAADRPQAVSPAAALAHPFVPPHGQHQGFSPLGLAAQAGYGGVATAPFMQVNVNLIQPQYPPPSFDWAAGPTANAAAAGRAAAQQDLAAALAASAASDVPPHLVPGSATHLANGRQGQDATALPAAPSGRQRIGTEAGSGDGPPRLASDAKAAQPGGHATAASDGPTLPPYAPHDAREQPQNEGLAVSPQMPGPSQGHYGGFDNWSAQFPIAAAFTQLLSPAAAAAAHAMGQIYPQVNILPLIDAFSLLRA